MRALTSFVRLSRPLFLYGGFAGVALGAAVAHAAGHALDVGTYLWAQALVTSFHLMVHYANDYFDRDGDAAAAERTRTAWSGGSGVLTRGALAPRVALIAALVCAALGVLCSVRFLIAGNTVTALLGIAILVFAWTYSAPPVRFAARGLGELDTALVVAALVPSVGFAAFAGALDARLAGGVAACAAAMFVMMLCVEMPDAGDDAATGKRTLVVRWTPSGAYSAIAAGAMLNLFVTLRAGRDAAGAAGIAAVLPALLVALALGLVVVRGDRVPRRVALLGVALYATTVTGLAAAYALVRA